MSLADRLAARHLQDAAPEVAVLDDGVAPVTPSGPEAVAGAGVRGSHVAVERPVTTAAPTSPAPTRTGDGLADVKARVLAELYERIGARINDPSLTEGDLHALVRAELAKVVDDQRLVLAQHERRTILQELEDDALGLGPMQRLLDDRTVTEIMVNGHDTIYVEREGRIVLSGLQFTDEDHLRRVIERIVARVGRRIDESSPLVDARLQDGSRVNAVIPPLAVKGSSLTIRKFSDTPFTVEDLLRFNSFSEPLADFLRGCVEAKLNILVSGGTGTGKTTLLNVLSSFIPADERIVTIEDAVELKLQQDHVVTLESRPPNIEGKGEVTIRDLVRNSLRMRPDRIVVGECRGGEALDMLQAMNTGHDGSISTLHANTPRDAIARLETLVLMAGMDLPLRAIREQIASAIDVVIQIQRLRDGSRRVSQVTEVIGMEGDVVTLQDAFVFDHSAGTDVEGRPLGMARATGLCPRFLSKFDAAGVEYDMSLFDPGA
ncbi:MAG: pilus assembly protein CpaF [Aeromicrobium sp.]|jgi:pilus assembly protein CpaF|nr:pilus assembly protein CpaF [Aeromicrobium sp.]